MSVRVSDSLTVQDDCCRTSAELMEVYEVSPEVQDGELMDIVIQVSPTEEDC